MENDFLKKFSSKVEKYVKCVFESECVYASSTKEWVGISYTKRCKIKEDPLNPSPKLLTTVAKSCASKCRICGFPIEKGTLRVGYPSKDPRGTYGYISCWAHLDCSKHLFFSVLYNENCKDHLEKYLNSEEILLKGENYNREELNIYNRINLDLFLGGYSELKEEEKEKVRNALKPYELPGYQYKNSIDAFTHEEQEKVTARFNSLNVESIIRTDNFSAPEELTCELLQYQIEGVVWMLQQEKSTIRGGILADEMGMGKTIQAIALLICQKKNMLKKEQEHETIDGSKKEDEVTNKQITKKEQSFDSCSVVEILSGTEEENGASNKKSKKKRQIKREIKSAGNIIIETNGKKSVKQEKKEKRKTVGIINGVPSTVDSSVTLAKDETIPKKNKLSGGTLIIAPVAAVMQWKTEIEKYVKDNFLQTYIYHDSSRNIPVEKLVKYDVVITSYPTVEVRFRKILNHFKIACEYCGRLYLKRTLVAHQKYFCGPLATRTEKLKKRKKKNKETALVAMKKFDDNFVPTPRNVLMEIMNEASMENGQVSVIDVEKANELLNEKIAATNKNSNGKEKTKGKGKRRTKSKENDKEQNKPHGKTSEEYLTKKDEKEEENYSSDHSVFSPLSRKTSSRLIDLCNLGFDKVAIEKVIDSLYKKQKKKKIYWNLVIKKVLENDMERLEMNGKCMDVLSTIFLSDREMNAEEIKKLNMGELKVVLIALGKHVFGTKIELVNRVLVSAKYIRQELHLIEKETGNKDIDEKRKHTDESTFVNLKREKSEETEADDCVLIDVKIKQEENTEYDKKNDNNNLGQNSKRLRRTESEHSTIAETDERKTAKSSWERGKVKREEIKRRHTVASNKKRTTRQKRRRSFALDESGNSDGSDETFSESDLIGTKNKEKENRNKRSVKKAKKEEYADDDDDDDSYDEDYDEDSEYDDDTDASYDSIYTRKGMSKSKKGKKKNVEEDEDAIDLTESVLHKIEWNRIILDEAHRIKNRIASTTQSIFNLQCSGSRWCLTGTPLQNRVGELFSLIRFLKFYPYAYYFCSRPKCKCFSLSYCIKDNKHCTICKHSKLSHFNYFNRIILKPLQQFGYSGEGTNSMLHLKEEVLDKILLRRTKAERQSDVKLKPLVVKIRKDKLSSEEKDFYESLYKQTSTQFDTYVKANTVLHNYAHIFDLLSRLRQAADHPYLIIFGNSFLTDPSGKFIKRNSSIIPAISLEHVCGICLENVPKHSLVQTKCKHNFHIVCMKQYLESFDMNTLGVEDEKPKHSDDSVFTDELQQLDSHNNIITETDKLSYSNSTDNIQYDNAGRESVSLLKKSATSPCVKSIDEENKSDNTLIIENTEELKRKAKTISNVKFKDKEKSKFISLLNNDKNVKQYPAGCPSCFVPLTFDNDVLNEMEDISDDLNNENEEEIVTDIKEEEKCKYVSKSIINRINTDEFQTSTKIKAVFEEVQNVIKETDDKCLIFSQYCSMLDLIEYHLKKNNIICAKLLGYMSMKSRNNILYNFNKDKQLRVLLISLKAGGEGLNLQVANRIFIVDPWWNPAAELQAIQRAHRIGQTKNVYAIRFIIENTVEEKMIQLQKKKQLVFDCTIGGSNDAMQKLTKEDLAFLFQA